MSSAPNFGLTPREQEIVQCLARGLTNREIADQMGMGQYTVKLNLFRIMEKFGVSSRIELLLVASPEFANAPCPMSGVKRSFRSGLLIVAHQPNL